MKPRRVANSSGLSVAETTTGPKSVYFWFSKIILRTLLFSSILLRFLLMFFLFFGFGVCFFAVPINLFFNNKYE